MVKWDHDRTAFCSHEFDSRQLHHEPLTKISIEIFVRVHGTAMSEFLWVVNALHLRSPEGATNGTGQYFLRGSMYYVYALLSEKDNNFYIGYTENINQRLDEHNAGKNVSTKLRRPLSLIYCEGHTSKSDALRRERYFKTTKGKATLKQILKDALSTNKSKLIHSGQENEWDNLSPKNCDFYQFSPLFLS